MTRDELRRGYQWLMMQVYDPAAYFARLRDGLGNATKPFAPARARYWRAHPLRRLKGQSTNLARAAVLFARLMRSVPDARLRQCYRREIYLQLLRRRDPGHLLGYVIRCAMHYHHYTLSAQVARGEEALVNSF
jgi:hypothetical protein